MGAASPRGRVWFGLMLPLLLAAQPMATDSYLPALPEIARALGSASTSLTLFALAFGCAQLLCGPLADRFGRRPVLLAGLAGYALAASGSALAGSVASLTAWRAGQGAAMAAILVCARAAVRDLYPAHEGPQVMARGLTGLGLMALAAPVLGAYLVQGVGWRWVMMLMAGYALLLWLLCWRCFGETRRPAAPAGALTSGGTRAVFASPAFRAWASLAAATYGGVFCFLLLSPMVYISYLGLAPSLYGWVQAGSSLVYIIGTVACRRLLHRFGPVSSVQGAALLSLAGAAVQVLGCWLAPASTWPLIAGHAVYMLGHGVHNPCGQAGAVSELPALAGRAVSWSGFAMMIAAFALGQTASHFMDAGHGAWPMVVPIVAVAMVLVVIAFAWLPRLQASRKK